jgi:hypothetical protein
MQDGWFHNVMGDDRTWQDRRGTPDSFGRALWGLGYCLRFAPRESWRTLARSLIAAAVPHVEHLGHSRSRAYAALGLVHAAAAGAELPGSGAALGSAVYPIAADFARYAAPDWVWCEPTLSYDNARLAEALIRGGETLGEPHLTDIGLRMLAFYADVVIEDGTFVPIGNDGWYRRGGPRARFGQQPIEAAGMIDASLAAYAATGDGIHRRNAEIAYSWFFGANAVGGNLVVHGGCCDGIDLHGIALAQPAVIRLHAVR